MRTVGYALMLALLPAASQAAEPSFTFGPLRLGMTYDEVRAATPTVKWIPTITGFAWSPTYLPVRFPYDYEMRGMTAKQAITVGGETFDVEYEDAAWNRYRLSARVEPKAEAEACAKRIFRVMEAVEAADGTLDAPERDPPRGRQQLAMAVGKKSRALMTLHPVKGFTLQAMRKDGVASIEIKGGTFVTRGAADLACWMEVNLNASPERPPQSIVETDKLQVTHAIGIGARHHSLDAAPAPPAGGVEVALACEIRDNGTLACNGDAGSATSPFLAAAKFRAGDMRVGRRTRDGRWTPGERTALVLKIMPEDRRTVGPVDVSKASLLQFADRSWVMTRFPTAAMDLEISAIVFAGCVVQTDGSPICPELRVEPPKLEAEFIAAMLPHILAVRYAPKLTNGDSSLGVGVRLQYEFKSE